MDILLVYATADGREPAARLAGLLKTLGATTFDAAEMASVPAGAGVIAVLTSAALADRAVLAALQRAPAEGRPLLPLPAPAPDYFPTAEDLARILEWRAAVPTAPASGPKYVVGTAINTAIGDNAVNVNLFGQAAGWSAAETAQLVAALRAQQAASAPMSATELRSLFAGLQAQLQQVQADLRQGFVLLLARFDASEQRILAPILARLDGQETAVVAAVLDALDDRLFPADELGRHLAVIQAALAEINARSAQIRDRQLAAAAQRAEEVISAPGLDVKHKLKLTIPLLPVLAYEGEFELNSKADLERAWQALRERFGRKR